MKQKELNSGFEGKVINGYTVCELLGEGYSGFVHRATKGNSTYAIKIIKPKLTVTQDEEKKQLKRIQAQIRVKKKISHPNLIKIYGGGKCKETGHLYLIMAHLPQGEFYSLNDLERPINADKIRPLLGQIASAAEILHKNNFVHRDIKPSNIMISKNESSAILLDLGVVKEVRDFESQDEEESEKSDSDFYGTRRYSPSEFLDSKKLSETKDYKWEAISFYQLGAILYVLMIGKPLFYREKASSPHLPTLILKGIEENELLDEISIQNKDAKLKELVLKCLTPNWRERIRNVKWSDFNFENLIPTIIMLYAGGTIGSKSSSGSKKRGLRQGAGENDTFFNSIGTRLRRNYKQIIDPEEEFPFRIIWESLPKDELILSENATPNTWNSIMKTVKELIDNYCCERPDIKSSEKNNKYIAGIIILHGTDTLAYTAAALTFGMKNLPCPIIITGSNQPPDEEGITEHDIISSKSDAWKNLMLSVNFIQCLGHRYTELFVAFNSTVFHAHNLKKVPLYNAYEAANTTESAIDEPYTYQNIYLPRKYMFKWIDGIFCNNFYPINRVHHDSLIDQKFHTRKDVFATPGKFSVSPYQNNKLELIVNTPVSDFSKLDLKGKEAIILIGYDSGTFSSDPKHLLSSSLKKWTKKTKLIFLISEFGLFPTDIKYQLHEKAEGKITVFELFGLIKETAVPFILNLLSKWEHAPERRLQTIKKSTLESKFEQIKKILDDDHWKNSVPGLVIGKPFEQSDHADRLKYSINSEAVDYKRNEDKLFDTAETSILYNKAYDLFTSRKLAVDETSFKNTVALQHELFLWFILRKCKRPIAIGYGPTEFKELNDMGFRFGKQFYNFVANKDITNTIEDGDIWTELTEKVTEKARETALMRIKAIAKNFALILKKIGLVDSTDCSVDITSGVKKTFGFNLKVTIRQHHPLDRNDVFSVKQFDGDEKDFFKSISNGTPSGSSNEEHRRYIKKRLSDLASSTWKQQLQPIDWFMLGLFKGFIYGSLCELRYDKWVRRFIGMTNYRNEQILKDSIRTNILTSDNKLLKFEMSYLSRDVYEDDIKIA